MFLVSLALGTYTVLECVRRAFRGTLTCHARFACCAVVELAASLQRGCVMIGRGAVSSQSLLCRCRRDERMVRYLGVLVVCSLRSLSLLTSAAPNLSSSSFCYPSILLVIQRVRN